MLLASEPVCFSVTFFVYAMAGPREVLFFVAALHNKSPWGQPGNNDKIKIRCIPAKYSQCYRSIIYEA